MNLNVIADGTLEFIGESVFNYLNGRINPTIKSSGIIFEPRRMVKCMDSKDSDYIAGLLTGNKILVMQNNIQNQLDKSRKIMGIDYLTTSDVQWIKTWYFEVIGHELSHLNQYTDSLRYSYDKDYRMEIELSNTKHTFTWLKEHEKEIEDIFGKLCFEDIFKNNSYASMPEYAKVKESDYVQAKEIGEMYKFFDLLSVCTLSDSLGLIKEAMSHGFERFGLVDWDESWKANDHITSFGKIADFVKSDNILHTITTYLTDTIMTSYHYVNLAWTLTTDASELILMYHKMGKVPSYAGYTVRWGLYNNISDKEIAFCDKYFDKEHYQYIGVLRDN